MHDRVWVLGAPDPEMQAIELLLRDCGEAYTYALDAAGARVAPAGAHSGRITLPRVPRHVYLVECEVDVEAAIDDLGGTDRIVMIDRIDHHRPGDPADLAAVLKSSSIGQTIAALARLPSSHSTPGMAGQQYYKAALDMAAWPDTECYYPEDDADVIQLSYGGCWGARTGDSVWHPSTGSPHGAISVMGRYVCRGNMWVRMAAQIPMHIVSRGWFSVRGS